MKKCIWATLLLSCLPIQAASLAWITDKLDVQLRSGPGNQYRILKQLTSGVQLSVTERNESTGYAHVTLESGEEGWILTRYLSFKPIASIQAEENTKRLNQLFEENNSLKAELGNTKTARETADKSNQELSAETARMNTEVIAIRQASANVLQIQAERDQLQEKVITLERELDTIRREKQALDSSNKQDWFMIGAGVLFGGILLGLVLPRLSWRKRASWDSF
ncbi:MAG: TIGR04211 family SH3 domain-containing protein [Methylococcaceae bacterium]|nr:TIGR04211 family SH3 domain-containing protein [Methylococcaceae bacterium]